MPYFLRSKRQVRKPAGAPTNAPNPVSTETNVPLVDYSLSPCPSQLPPLPKAPIFEEDQSRMRQSHLASTDEEEEELSPILPIDEPEESRTSQRHLASADEEEMKSLLLGIADYSMSPRSNEILNSAFRVSARAEQAPVATAVPAAATRADLPDEDRRSLDPGQQLTDECIVAYVKHLEKHVWPIDGFTPDKYQVISPAVCALLPEEGRHLKITQKWTFFPMNVDNNHWVLCFSYYNEERPQHNRLFCYDSLVSDYAIERQRRVLNVVDEAIRLMNPRAVAVERTVLTKPSQSNGYDCGVYVLKFLRYFPFRSTTQYLAKDEVLIGYEGSMVEKFGRHRIRNAICPRNQDETVFGPLLLSGTQVAQISEVGGAEINENPSPVPACSAARVHHPAVTVLAPKGRKFKQCPICPKVGKEYFNSAPYLTEDHMLEVHGGLVYTCAKRAVVRSEQCLHWNGRRDGFLSHLKRSHGVAVLNVFKEDKPNRDRTVAKLIALFEADSAATTLYNVASESEWLAPCGRV